MSVDLASLVLAIDSSQVKVGSDALDKLSQSGSQAEQAINKVGGSAGGMGSAVATAHSYVSSLVVSMAALIGVSISVAGAFELVKKGIEDITQYNVGAISTAAMMLSRANVDGIHAQQAAYGEYKSYVLGMYEALEAETERHFASGKEMIGGFDAFARKGIYAAQEEAGAIGVITDAVKLLHRGYVDEATMQHEIQGLLEGHAGIRFKLAQQLKGMLGETWKEQVQEHAQAGTLLTFLEEKFKGLAVAAGDIQKNLMAQRTTLDTLISQVGRGGLAGVYADLVGFVSDINSYLRVHKDQIIIGIASAWVEIKYTVKDVWGYVSDIVTKTAEASSKLVRSVSDRPTPAGADDIEATANRAADALFKFYAVLGSVPAGIINTLSGVVDIVKYLADIFSRTVMWLLFADYKDITSAKEAIDHIVDIVSRTYNWVINVSGNLADAYRYVMGIKGSGVQSGIVPAPHAPYTTVRETQTFAAGLGTGVQPSPLMAGGTMLVTPFQPPPDNPALDAGKKKGGGTEGAENRMTSILDTLDKELAKLSEGSLAEVDAWLKKMLDDIEKVAVKGIDGAQAELKAREVAAAKKLKIEDEFNLYVAKETGDRYAAIEEKYNQDMIKYKGTADEMMKLDAIRTEKRKQVDYTYYQDIENLQKDFLSKYAASLPLLSQQLPIQKQLLDVDIERARLSLEEKIRKDRIPEYVANELRGLQAVAAQEQRMAEARKGWMLEGIGGGLKSWALDRSKESETKTAQWTIDAMKGAESWLGNTGGQAFVDALHGKKTDLTKMFSDIGDSLIKQIWTMGVTKLFDVVGGALGGAGLKPDGSAQKPFHVISAGAVGGIGAAEAKASKIGYTTGAGSHGGDSGLDFASMYKSETLFDRALDRDQKGWLLGFKNLDKEQNVYTRMQDKMADGNKEVFNTTYMKGYETDFSTMTTGITSIWGVAQGAMTAAGASGEAQRYSTMASYGVQAITLLYNIVAKGILAKAWSAGAAAYASTWEFLGFPWAVVLAPIMAAVAFAGTIAAGSSGGSGGSGGSRFHSGGVIYAHSGYLADDERHIIVQTGERILSRSQNRDYEAGMKAGGGNGGGINIVVNHSPSYNYRATEADYKRDARMMVKAINQEIGTRGQKLGDGRT